MNEEFWTNHYKKHKLKVPSTFAKFVLPLIQGDLVDIGCGDGRDLYYFKKNGIQAHGVDASYEDIHIIKQPIQDYLAENSPAKNVYARFFWHAIERKEQLAILDWVQGNLFIEARTDHDKPHNVIGKHKRNLVNVNQLFRDLIKRDYQITHFSQGYGFSPYKGEDPHLFRLVARRMV